jgi:hypothetical protein
VAASYWSSTNFANNPFLARAVSLSSGDTASFNAAATWCVWAVRDDG